MGRIVPLQRPERPRFTRLGDFSDSFLTRFYEVRRAPVLRRYFLCTPTYEGISTGTQGNLDLPSEDVPPQTSYGHALRML
jgi:hypothetical protein